VWDEDDDNDGEDAEDDEVAGADDDAARSASSSKIPSKRGVVEAVTRWTYNASKMAPSRTPSAYGK
jgi:hypothetical protein